MDTVQFHVDVLYFVFLFLFLYIFFFRIFLVCALLKFFLFLFNFLQEFIIFLAQTILVVSILVNEAEEYVFHRTPRSMVTHTITFAGEEYGIAIHHPTWRTAGITAIGQVSNFTTLCAYNTYIVIRVMLVAIEAKCEPFSVRTPLVFETTSCAWPISTIGNLAYLLGIEVYNHQLTTVLNEGQFLTVRRERWVTTFNLVR